MTNCKTGRGTGIHMTRNRINMSNEISMSKGFFFVLVSFFILGYILTSLTLWTKSIDVAEKKFAEKFKFSNVELAVSQLTEEKVSDFAEMSAYYALYKLNEHSITYPLVPAEGVGISSGNEAEFKNAKDAVWSLIQNGSASGNYFEESVQLVYDTSEQSDLTFAGWFGSINKSLSYIGAQVDSFGVSSFTMNQTDYSHLNYSFKVVFSASDKSGIMFITRSFVVNGTLELQGLDDPAVARETKEILNGSEVRKQFFFHEDYPSPASTNPAQISSGSAGQGWFYGAIVQAINAPSITPFQRNTTILVGTYEEITSQVGINYNYQDFGAFILTSEPTFVDSGCGGSKKNELNTFNAIDYGSTSCAAKIKDGSKTEKPFIVAKDFLFDDVQKYQGLDNKFVLFVNSADQSEVSSSPEKKFGSPKIYDIELLRDYAICSYYTTNPKAPSYFQRLFKNSYELGGGKSGIESFVFGKWLGGSDYPAADIYSRLDREMFKEITGINVRGMPGCKNKEMCGSDSQIGHFKLTDQSAKNYIGPDATDSTNGLFCSKGASCGN